MDVQPTDPAQMMLMALPGADQPSSPAPATPKVFRNSAVTKRSRAGTPGPQAEPSEAGAQTSQQTVQGVTLVDPRDVEVDPVNVRFGISFDPVANAELIESMRAVGNTVPVQLRRDPNGGRKLLCPSGSRRLGTALLIQKDEPGFRLRAIVSEEMSDKQAFEIAEADNAGRTGVTPMQQARKWAELLDQVYGGDRQEFIAATGKSASLVSRTLALLTLPDYVLACCSDVEALTPYFTEKLGPSLKKAAEEPGIRRRAEALIAADRRLPGDKLASALLRDPTAPAVATRNLWASPEGDRSLTFTPGKKASRLEIVGMAGLDRDQRRAVLKAVDELLRSVDAK